jgi:serine/threonine protein phosphatase PrpC
MGSAAPATVTTRVRVGGATHPGRKRRNNQDFLLARADLGLFVVADGVGGRNTGEVASSLAALSMTNFFESTQRGDWPDEYRALLDLTLSPPAQRLSAAIRKANSDVHRIASTHTQHHKMNTTVVAAHLPKDDWRLHIGHVGDSRCYRVRDNVMELLTRDHSLRNEAQIEYPNIDQARLNQIPLSVLARAIGRRDTVELALKSFEVRPGDTFLLCSDGVTRMIDDTRVLGAMLVGDDPQEVADLMVALSNEAGGRDNITALVLKF